MDLKFSVIIPVYNVAEIYLRRCLDSVHIQTYVNMEVLLVIDGATDNSPAICKEYAERDNRFVVHKKPNSGAGATRNFAIQCSTGDYILFVDSDDYWLDAQFIEKVAACLVESNADVLSFGYQEFYRESEAPTKVTPGGLDRAAVFGKSPAIALSNLLRASRSNFSSSVITKSVKTSLLFDNNIRFIEGINCEDAHFTALLLIHASSYDRLNLRAYAVRRHTSSTSRVAANSRKIAESMLNVFENLFSRYNLREPGYERVLDFLSSPYLYALGKLTSAYDKKILAGLAKYKFVLTYSSRPYVKVTGLFANVFGLRPILLALRVFLLMNRKSHVSISKSMGGK